jgi:hypothetical protein
VGKIHLKKFSKNRSRRAAGTELISKKIHLKKFPKNRSRCAAGTLLCLPLPTPLLLPPSKPYPSCPRMWAQLFG